MTIGIVLIVLFGMILIGVPISFAMLATTGLYFLTSPTPFFIELLPAKIFEGLDNIILIAIPFFLLAGELMSRSGMADRLMHFSNLVIGRVRGGFAYVNVMASLLFSGLTGVAVGDIAALGKIEVLAMEKAGYPRHFAAAVTVASSLVGPIIPPSGVIILYCAIMNVSVGGMFLAALVPGVILALADMLVIAFQAKKRNFPLSDVDRSLPAFVKGTRDAALALLMPAFLIGGIVGGVTTPTEAAAASVVYALIVSVLIYRALSVKEVGKIFMNTTFEAARLLFMIAGALSMTWIFALEDLAGQVAFIFDFAKGSPLLLILLINCLFILLGMFMDAALALILFGPIVAPLAYSVGVDPLQLGIMLIINVTVGLATPPIGYVLFAMCSVVRLNFSKLVAELIPFLMIKAVLLIIIGLVPALTTWVPGLFGF
ncbi:TRAP transporter large permease [Sulfitobacter sp. PR48]|uniref:TRAP transporter large permease n=1 Tax=unclassified Sulfitobacter TaxID=196795 RepID=UPI0022AF86A8|nr:MULTISPECIES: TRAP transporter large permease [unclassified Sulfitobacter]MCZ4254313.1 TRAP transporter large permease [Sulfitobacter sp. G21635-S1]MDD9721901.1 TRAP transporter large permease [Sulfitobacter sp. PR48]GLT11308.1 ABC transporter permease [Sulfitobacter porphyrae]